MSKNSEKKVHIIGAGVSGLIAAINLEKLGYHPVIIDSDSNVGGRVQTDIVEGYQLDRGFQVLLDSYPMAKKYLNYVALELQSLDAGALIYADKKAHLFGDPLRDILFLLPTITSPLATFSDKLKVFQLNKQLKKTDINEIFEREEQTTFDYLKSYGFTPKVINSFFKPFFSGIFLEPDLNTSSRMFEFVYKMFSTGKAMIPKAGMGAIPKQLRENLNQTEIMFNAVVKEVVNGKILLENGEQLLSDFTIVATEPKKMMTNYSTTLKWKSCDNLYFKVNKRSIEKPIIGLNASESSLVNNIFYSSSIPMSTKGDQQLLSVTVVKRHGLILDELINAVKTELANDFQISDITFLKHYHIPHALPDLKDLKNNRDEGESLLSERIAVAGDYLLNGSLNAAMLSGEKAAEMADRVLSGNMLAV